MRSIRIIFFVAMSLIFTDIFAQVTTDYAYMVHKKRTKNHIAHKIGFFIGDIIMDALYLQRYLFTISSAQIFTATTPFYLITRRFEDGLQAHFYDAGCHKNRNQLPKICHNIARFGVGIPMIALTSLAFIASDVNLRQTARVFAIGWPFVHWGKELLKNIETKACLRPWHEDFSCKKRSPGGFPSGHMANITYATTLFGMRFGKKFGIPLGLCAAFVLVDFVNCNRHYLSQIIAGAAFGAMFAFAADKVIERRLERVTVSFCADKHGRMGMKMSYLF